MNIRKLMFATTCCFALACSANPHEKLMDQIISKICECDDRNFYEAIELLITSKDTLDINTICRQATLLHIITSFIISHILIGNNEGLKECQTIYTVLYATYKDKINVNTNDSAGFSALHGIAGTMVSWDIDKKCMGDKTKEAAVQQFVEKFAHDFQDTIDFTIKDTKGENVFEFCKRKKQKIAEKILLVVYFKYKQTMGGK